MDPVYGTKRRAVPLLVEDVNQGETSMDVKSINSKMDDLNGKIEALNNTIKSTVPMGCYTHYRYVTYDEGEATWHEGGELDNTPNLIYTNSTTKFRFLILTFPSATTNGTVQITNTSYLSTANAIFPIFDTSKISLYNPFDDRVLPQEVTNAAITLQWPIHLKTPIPYPTNIFSSSSYRTNCFPNGYDVAIINKTIGTTSSSGNTVIGLLKSISNKL